MKQTSIRSRSFTPPAAVAKEARLGQRIRASMPPSQQCCVETGIRRGEQLASRSPVTVDDMITMRAWFDRHEVDKRGQGWGVDSKGYQAWLLWGGDSGRAWVEDTLAELGIGRHRAAATRNPLSPLIEYQFSPADVKRLNDIESEWQKCSELSDLAYEDGDVDRGDYFSECADTLAEKYEYVLSEIQESEHTDEAESDIESELAGFYEDYRTGGRQRGLHSEAELAESVRWLLGSMGSPIAKEASERELVGIAYDAWLWKTKLRRRIKGESR